MTASVKSGAAREKTVAVGYLTNIVLCSACRNDGTCAAVLPEIDVVLSVESNNTSACCAGGGLDSNTFAFRNGKKTVWICVTKVVLAEKRKLVKIVNALDVVGGNALFLHLLSVIGNVVPDVLDLLYKSFVL